MARRFLAILDRRPYLFLLEFGVLALILPFLFLCAYIAVVAGIVRWVG